MGNGRKGGSNTTTLLSVIKRKKTSKMGQGCKLREAGSLDPPVPPPIYSKQTDYIAVNLNIIAHIPHCLTLLFNSFKWGTLTSRVYARFFYFRKGTVEVACITDIIYNPGQNYLRKFSPSCPLSYATKLFPKPHLCGKKPLPPIQCCFPQMPKDQAFF